MAISRLHQVERRSASRAVSDQLIALIETGDLHVGDRLPSENELAQSLGVSRPVVREALERLRALGLVVSRTGRGSFVAARRVRGPLLLGQYSGADLHEVRSLLEIPGAGIAAKSRANEDVVSLLRTIDELERCDRPDEWVRLDALFHVKLAEATCNEVHALIVGYLRDLLVEQSLAVSSVPGRIRSANEEHRAIYEAVRAGDRRAAEAAMARHLARGRQSWELVEKETDGDRKSPQPVGQS
jgi:GntR family transcriptional regulator, transcriptional repressor for pyruvate dehydrogenase complex